MCVREKNTFIFEYEPKAFTQSTKNCFVMLDRALVQDCENMLAVIDITPPNIFTKILNVKLCLACVIFSRVKQQNFILVRVIVQRCRTRGT